jgi:hypothetical protein
VSVSTTRGVAHNGDYHPLCLLVAISQVEEIQVVRSQTAAYIQKFLTNPLILTTSGTAVDYHLELIDTA